MPMTYTARSILFRFTRPSILGVNKVYPVINRTKTKKNKPLSSIIEPVTIKSTSNPGDANVGKDITGISITKTEILQILSEFYKRPHLMQIAEENGLDNKLFQKAFESFRLFCTQSNPLPIELHILFSDILQKYGHVDDLIPSFIKHARQIFPHLDCLEELKRISDLKLPINWYPEARAIKRKIIFHCGPTNSGKTFNALKRFFASKSGVYCGPLKLLAVEVHEKANQNNTPCDLVTGEERRYANPSGLPSKHVASTVEMVSLRDTCDVAIIDEIQMLRDPQRGWAWTRALLGIPAREIHLCGEEAALDIVRELVAPIGEEVHVNTYERLTKLTVEDSALGSLENVQPGDCIVCFNKNDLYSVVMKLEQINKQVAVIYGGLPPGTKLSQARRFNNPQDPCKLLVATDAIGMGLNLSIRRVIFYSITKPSTNLNGEISLEFLRTSNALQIAGRAGRYNTVFEEGFVTTFRHEDLPTLKDILDQPVDPIDAAGLHPTADQIELFAYYLPESTLSNLIDIFVSICSMDSSNYFMCDIGSFKFLADMIQHIKLPLRARYVFCCAPINLRMHFVCSMFTKFARQYSFNEPATLDWLCTQLSWPLKQPINLMQLLHLESVFDVLDLYLWLSYRFHDLFPDADHVREMQKELDDLIHQGVLRITKLIRNSNKKESGQIRSELGEKHKLKKSELLSDQLISSGTLTPKIIEQLYKEWSEKQKRGK